MSHVVDFSDPLGSISELHYFHIILKDLSQY